MPCNNCNTDKVIVNKHFGLCLECNNLRLYGNKYGKVYKGIGNNNKSTRASKKPKKFRNKSKEKPKKSLFSTNIDYPQPNKISTIDKDEEFYEKCFNACKVHECEECEQPLPTRFRDDEGKVIARWRYSHIIPKSIASHLRHILENINHLCITCHTRWDHADKYNMKIYSKNTKKFPNYF